VQEIQRLKELERKQQTFQLLSQFQMLALIRLKEFLSMFQIKRRWKTHIRTFSPPKVVQKILTQISKHGGVKFWEFHLQKLTNELKVIAELTIFL
jgi:uncharacterized FAD-dependent dehydrogenase